MRKQTEQSGITNRELLLIILLLFVVGAGFMAAGVRNSNVLAGVFGFWFWGGMVYVAYNLRCEESLPDHVENQFKNKRE